MNAIDNLWFEKRDASTQDEKTHDLKFHKELLARFKKTQEIKQTRTDATVFPVATQDVDLQPNMVSPTLVLLAVLTCKRARENRVLARSIARNSDGSGRATPHTFSYFSAQHFSVLWKNYGSM